MRKVELLFIGLSLAFCNTGREARRSDFGNRGIKPNIIYILADDLGYGDIKSLNRDSRIPTPNIDRIVQEGVHFTNAHSNSAVCTPTRYGILTGRYAFRTRLTEGVVWGYTPSLIEPGRLTVASFLQENGYQTACIGKWHLGLDWARKDPSMEIPDNPNLNRLESPRNFDDNVDYSKPVKGGPADAGFDYSYIIPASLDMMPYCYIRNDMVVEHPDDFTDGRNQDRDGRGVFWRQGKMAPGFDFYNVLPEFIDSAYYYIKERAGNDTPFFLYLSLPSPHTPWMPLDEYSGSSEAGKYGDFVKMTDDLIGKIIDQVDKSGMSRNTLIIFTSDNGADWRPSDIEEYGHHANYFFRGRKGDIYEAGHRVPFAARWTGVIPAGHRSDEIMCTTDLLATFAGLLNKKMPIDSGEDSFNMWPAFIGEPESTIRESVIVHSQIGFFAIRKGNWKYTPHLGSGGFSLPRIIEPDVYGIPGTLYNLENDPGEEINLYEQHPEIVEELRALLKKYRDQGYSRPVW